MCSTYRHPSTLRRRMPNVCKAWVIRQTSKPQLSTILLNLHGLEMLLARTAHVSFKYSLWGLVYFYISPGMPLNTGISDDIYFINSWAFIHFHLSIVVIECFGDISTRYDNYVAHQHIHHLHGEQMNLIKETWHTRHTPRVYPYLCNPTPVQGGIPPCL